MSLHGQLNTLILTVSKDKRKFKTRLITSLTVLFLILAGSPAMNLSGSVGAQDNPYASITISNLANTPPTQVDLMSYGISMNQATTGCIMD